MSWKPRYELRGDAMRRLLELMIGFFVSIMMSKRKLTYNYVQLMKCRPLVISALETSSLLTKTTQDKFATRIHRVNQGELRLHFNVSRFGSLVDLSRFNASYSCYGERRSSHSFQYGQWGVDSQQAIYIILLPRQTIPKGGTSPCSCFNSPAALYEAFHLTLSALA